MTYPKHLLHFGSKTIEYSVIPSKRIKTSEIIVDANEIIVRTPYTKTASEVQKIVKKKEINVPELAEKLMTEN